MRTNAPTLILLLAAFALMPTLAAAQADKTDLQKPFLYDKLIGPEQTVIPARGKSPFDEHLVPINIKHKENLEREVFLVANTNPEVEKIRQQFVGNWKLLFFSSRRGGGELVSRPMTGRIMYDRDGNMAAQLMPEIEPDDIGRRGRYVAYFGKFSIDTEKSEVTHHVEGSNFDHWVNTDLVRRYAIEINESAPDRLTLSLWDGGENIRLVWERLSK